MNQPAYEDTATAPSPSRPPTGIFGPDTQRGASARDQRHGRSACCAADHHYQELLDLLPDVYLLTDPHGVITEASAAVSALFGTARTYVIGKPLASFVHTQDRPKLRAQLQTLGDGKPRPAQWQGRMRPKRREEDLHVGARIRPLVAAGGEVVGLQWLLRDVSAEHERAARLAALEHELETRVRTRTSELEAIVRLQAAQLGAVQARA